jgi:hypothetical protein
MPPYFFGNALTLTPMPCFHQWDWRHDEALEQSVSLSNLSYDYENVPRM